ncbi:putative DNA modification/repair radical SAM protein [Legionella beliardensis]|uniref:Putative DNA modification/repair radical SAM protein n=1 Tax=Legionella beliardensis TaxID=91822 RepID=A0A378I3E3_9GAMM|nr:putative DNA modification/repair radical SAM protein [Legionella beliardensis]STX29221.1 putative DNA modification/repair radical SAM protein [Legionella beliardensis]
MDINKKLSILADAAKYDASCSSSGAKKNRGKKGLGSTTGMGICHSYTPDGRCISLLKILLTNYCIFDCKYCINRVSSDVVRATFTVKEVVNLTLDFYRRNYIEGLFLSSGIIRSADYTMEQLILVAKSLRQEHHFRGYIHLKTIPNAAESLVQEAGLYADRLSINIELPTAEDLKQLAPEKKRDNLEKNMADVELKRQEIKEDKKKGLSSPIYVPAGQTTQMIVGATPSTDKVILQTSSKLYKDYNLRRVYYSAYSPIPHADARLPSIIPPLLREHRLYQADWLLRFYNYQAEEIVPDSNPNLDIELDPKTSWALRNPAIFPIDINKASRYLLLRIPGIGVRTVDKLLTIRRFTQIYYKDLIQLKISMNKARYFICTADYKPPKNLNPWDLKKNMHEFQQLAFDFNDYNQSE